MPVDSDLTLPQTFRPLGVRMAIYVAGALLVLVVVVTWFAFPQDIRDQFTYFQRGTVIGLGLMFYAGGFALARSRLVAREDGLTVVNGYRSRRFAWAEVVAGDAAARQPVGGARRRRRHDRRRDGHPGLRRPPRHRAGPPPAHPDRPELR